MLWLIAFGSAVFIYAALAASRRRKQLLVDRTWRNELPSRLGTRLGLVGIHIDEAKALALAGAFFDALYEGYGVRSFGALMRAITVSDASENERISKTACERAAALLPEASRVSAAAMIRVAVDDAGAKAQAASEQSGEI